MWRTLVVAVIVTLAAACGGGSEGDASGASWSPEETTTSTSPEQGFLADVETRLAFEGTDGPDAALDFARAACDALDAAYPPGVDRASAGSVAITGLTMMLADAGNLPDDVAGVVLTLGAERLCPQHTETISEFLDVSGIDVAA